MRLTYYRIWLTLGGVLLATVWWLSLTPKPPSIDLPYGDKWGHLAAYTAQMLWAAWLWPHRRWVPALSLCVMGALLEVLQGMTGYRIFEFADMAANATGVFLGWALSYTPLSLGLPSLDAILARRFGKS
ncbi:VanZ family protein [Gammaproteobacteria bacterium]